MIASSPCRLRRAGARCSLASSERESRGGDRAVEVEEELGPVLKFEMTDFAMSNHVSVGLHGRVSNFFDWIGY